MRKPTILLSSAFLCLGIVGCSSDSNDDDTETTTDTTTDSTTGTSSGNFDSSMYSSAFKSVSEVSCTLENGSSTTCYEIVFAANGAGDTEGDGTIGPYCPESINTARSESGVGIYDGDTTPGFQSLVDAAIAMDADGYDIVDDAGNIRFNDLQAATEAGYSYCLSATFDSAIEITYTVPIVPEFNSEPTDIATVGSIGFGLTGVPYKGNPPSVTVAEAGIGGTGSGNIPALDLCGGHPDPQNYYHWHMVPQAMNTLLASDKYNYTELYDMTCSNSNIAYDSPASFAGLAKDGFPIYGAFDLVDSENTTPGDVATVDECNGHTHTTDEFPDGVYHYHALEDVAPNVPKCLVGSFVDNGFTLSTDGAGGPPGGGPPGGN